MYHFSDNSRKAQKWRIEQAHIDNAIEGVEKDEEIAALVARWDAKGVPDEEQIKRLKEMTTPEAFSMRR